LVDLISAAQSILEASIGAFYSKRSFADAVAEFLHAILVECLRYLHNHLEELELFVEMQEQLARDSS
jgi:hypothetical protein